MTTTAEKIKIMQAFKDGQQIQVRGTTGLGYCSWSDTTIKNPVWNWRDTEYRIAPKPKKKMWQWIVINSVGNIIITPCFYENEDKLRLKIGRTAVVIGKAEWTEIEIDGD
jgi:hypothetical protein